MSLETSVFEAPDGAEIAYRIRPGRDPIVLLHGLGCDASLWDGVVAALPSDLGLVIPELRGHGGSTLGWTAPSVELWADDIVRILAMKRIDSPAIAGPSMGGYVAFAIASAHPELARAYAFISTTASADDAAGRYRRSAGIATIRRAGWQAFLAEQLPAYLNPERPNYDKRVQHVDAMFARAGDSGLPSALMALAARPDRRAMLMTIQAPAVVIVGAVDTLTPPDNARAMAAGIHGARLHVVEDVAHLSALEAPHKLAGIVGTL
jgi:pimeloyl-ACP methyl ester carboxylesterase